MVSVIIITRNEEKNISRTISSLNDPRVNQIIVVDSRSRDKTREIVESLNDTRISFRTVKTPKLTAAAGRQEGLKYIDTSNQYTLFLDGDMELNSSFFDTAIPILEASKIGGITGQRTDYIYDETSQLIRKVDNFYDVNREMFLGGAFMVKNDVLLQYGKFDTSFPILEETFFYQRLRKNGYFIIRIPDEMIIHHMLSSTSKTHLIKRLLDNKLQAYGIVLYHLKEGQFGLFFYRIKNHAKAWVIVALVIIGLNLSIDLKLILVFLLVGMYLASISLGGLIRSILFLIFLPMGWLGELLTKKSH